MSARYPHAPGFKAGDTSKAAAESMAGKAAGLRAKVIAALREAGPLTVHECAGKLGLSVPSIQPRFSELRELGRVEDTGLRRQNTSGRSAAVWGVAA